MKERLGLALAGILVLSIAGITSASASETDTDFIVDIDPQAMLVIPNTPVRLSVTPSQDGAFDSASFDVFASTNSKSGYTLIMEANKTHLESSYVDADTGIAARIPAMPFRDGGLSKNDFMNSSDENVINHWGISIDNESSFNPIDTSAVVKSTAAIANNDKTTVNVATKINTDADFGNYSTTINFALLPNVVNIPQGVSGGEIDIPSGGEGGNFAAGSLGRSFEIYYQEVLQKSVYVKDDSTPEGYHSLREGEDTTGKQTYFAMQDMSPTVCNRVTVVPDQLQVIDLRDAKVYWIAKLKDGKCWMTQNLDFNLSTEVTLTPADTDVRRNWTPMVSTLDYDGLTTSYIGAYKTNNDGTPYSLDVGDWYWTDTWYNNSNSYYYLNGDLGGDPPKFQYRKTFAGNGEHGHVGNYYSWPAASAGASGGGAAVDTSICPSNWRLPRFDGNSSNYEQNEFYQLIMAHGGMTDPDTGGSSDKNFTYAPLYLVRAGYMSGSFSSPGGYGYYWNAYPGGYIYFYYSYSYLTGYTSSQYYGYSVRCVAR